jgi:hypothetical protein
LFQKEPLRKNQYKTKSECRVIAGIRFYIAQNLFLPDLHLAALCRMHRCKPIVRHENQQKNSSLQ